MFDKAPTSYPEDESIHPSQDTKCRNLLFEIEDKTYYDPCKRFRGREKIA